VGFEGVDKSRLDLLIDSLFNIRTLKKMKNLMIDIETLGTKSYSVIATMAAVEFDIETGDMGRNFYAKISISDSLLRGLNVDPKTMEWWRKQSAEAKLEVFNERCERSNLQDALVALRDFVGNIDYFMWANSPRFDLGLIENALDVCNISRFWDFRKERDVRTFVDGHEKLWDGMRSDKDTAHHALTDCAVQVKMVTHVYSLKTNSKKKT
jgi:hypothetical protein